MNWRIWLPWIILFIVVGILAYSSDIAAGVIQAIGMNTLRAHAILSVIFSLVIGIIFASVFILILWKIYHKSINPRMYQPWRAILLIILGFLCLGRLMSAIPSLFADLGNYDYRSIYDDISTLFSRGVYFSILMESGIMLLIFHLKRKRLAS